MTPFVQGPHFHLAGRNFIHPGRAGAVGRPIDPAQHVGRFGRVAARFGLQAPDLCVVLVGLGRLEGGLRRQDCGPGGTGVASAVEGFDQRVYALAAIPECRGFRLARRLPVGVAAPMALQLVQARGELGGRLEGTGVRGDAARHRRDARQQAFERGEWRPVIVRRNRFDDRRFGQAEPCSQGVHIGSGVPERFQRRGVLLEARQRRGPFPTQNVALRGQLRVVAPHPFGGRDDRFGSPDEIVPVLPQALQQAETVARDAMHGLVPRTGEVLECDQPVLVADGVRKGGTRIDVRHPYDCPSRLPGIADGVEPLRRRRAQEPCDDYVGVTRERVVVAEIDEPIRGRRRQFRTIALSGVFEQRAECVRRRDPRQRGDAYGRIGVFGRDSPKGGLVGGIESEHGLPPTRRIHVRQPGLASEQSRQHDLDPSSNVDRRRGIRGLRIAGKAR